MKEWGMHPVLPGYSGMIPSKLDLGKRIDSGKEEKTASDTSSESAQSTLNKWNGFDRPGILLPDDPKFTRIANLFYEETENCMEQVTTTPSTLFMKPKLTCRTRLRQSRQGYYGRYEKGQSESCVGGAGMDRKPTSGNDESAESRRSAYP